MKLVSVFGIESPCVLLAEWPDGCMLARQTLAHEVDWVYDHFGWSVIYVTPPAGRRGSKRVNPYDGYYYAWAEFKPMDDLEIGPLVSPQSRGKLDTTISFGRLSWFVHATAVPGSFIPAYGLVTPRPDMAGTLQFDFEPWKLLGENPPPWWDDERFDGWVRDLGAP